MTKVIGGIAAVLVIGGLIWYFFFSQAIPGYWALNKEESAFYFSTTKNGDITEQHTIKNVDGEADFSGHFLIRLDLKSVDTGIEIRNERMKEYLFQVDTYPVARVEGSFRLGDLAEIAVGDAEDHDIPFTLTLHGVTQPMSAVIHVSRPEWATVVISPVNPIVIHAADFNLDEGIETLKGLAGLDDISHDVPIDFQWTFEGSSTP